MKVSIELTRRELIEVVEACELKLKQMYAQIEIEPDDDVSADLGNDSVILKQALQTLKAKLDKIEAEAVARSREFRRREDDK